MQTKDVVVFSVVITLVSGAMAHSVICNDSDKPSRVHVIQKIIGLMSLGAAALPLLVSVSVLGENRGGVLILDVFATVGIGTVLQKRKQRGASQPTGLPVPGHQVRQLSDTHVRGEANRQTRSSGFNVTARGWWTLPGPRFVSCSELRLSWYPTPLSGVVLCIDTANRPPVTPQITAHWSRQSCPTVRPSCPSCEDRGSPSCDSASPGS